ncbi:MAG: HAMP domain-containing histidine kinase [Oscillospiraceae bacterium]|nr:HAMP domain-containing histidine kinase [Oscillospiraceae bacterium]
MKTRFFWLHPGVLWRGGIVAAVTAVFGVMLGPIISRLIDNLYRQSDSSFWFKVFYTISQNRSLFLTIGCIIIFVPAIGWIIQPFLKRYADMNEELKRSQYAAKEAEQRKDDLVVCLAHDIRTPLTSVLGYLELLTEQEDLPEAQRRKYTDSALRKAKRMGSLVEELFEITRYSVTQIELEKTEVNLSMMLAQLLEEMRPVFEQRGIKTEVSLEETLPAFIDPEKMARSLDNILHNAAFYTPPGGRVTVTLDKAEHFARIMVSNTGTEIPPEKLARFFEKFYRGEEARQSETGGSGLGLAIAKNIIEAHGGSITAENKDKTTTFTVLLSFREQ